MRRLLTPGWLACHALVLVLIVGMLGLAGWQFARASGGNSLSWGYTVQWPIFAGFVAFIWWREVRRVLRSPADSPASSPDSLASSATSESTAEPAAGATATTARRPVITRRPAPVSVPDGTADPALAEYNRYLAWLSAHPGARPVDYPG